jgi:hypothetical protein
MSGEARSAQRHEPGCEECVDDENRGRCARGTVLVGSVLRAMRSLDLFERGRPEMNLTDVVRRSGYSKSTTIDC